MNTHSIFTTAACSFQRVQIYQEWVESSKITPGSRPQTSLAPLLALNRVNGEASVVQNPGFGFVCSPFAASKADRFRDSQREWERESAGPRLR